MTATPAEAGASHPDGATELSNEPEPRPQPPLVRDPGGFLRAKAESKELSRRLAKSTNLAKQLENEADDLIKNIKSMARADPPAAHHRAADLEMIDAIIGRADEFGLYERVPPAERVVKRTGRRRRRRLSSADMKWSHLHHGGSSNGRMMPSEGPGDDEPVVPEVHVRAGPARQETFNRMHARAKEMEERRKSRARDAELVEQKAFEPHRRRRRRSTLRSQSAGALLQQPKATLVRAADRDARLADKMVDVDMEVAKIMEEDHEDWAITAARRKRRILKDLRPVG